MWGSMPEKGIDYFTPPGRKIAPKTAILVALGSAAGGILALAIAVLCAGAGHGTYLPAMLLFPYAMLMSVGGHTITNDAIVLGLLQYPGYGLFLGVCGLVGKFRIAATILAAIHMLALVACICLLGGG